MAIFTRVVKLTLSPEKTGAFILMFESRKELIAGSDGCSGVQLLRDISNQNIFFTISHWRDEASLDKYRNSELFVSTWSEVKQWFAGKPEAWTLEQVK